MLTISRVPSSICLSSGLSRSGTAMSTRSSAAMLLTSMKNTISRNTTSINGVMFMLGVTRPF